MYAEAIDIKIERKDEEGDGAYLPTRRVIRLDPDMDDSTEIATFLHELGHVVDGAMVGHQPALERAYGKVYAGKVSAKQLALILAAEKRAWDNGRAIAYKLRISLGKWYDDEEREALKDYGDA